MIDIAMQYLVIGAVLLLVLIVGGIALLRGRRSDTKDLPGGPPQTAPSARATLARTPGRAAD